MTYRLIRMNVSGIKNIIKPITINFLGDTISKSSDIKKSNVKAIYGSNGAGKSAIINAVEIYKELTSNNSLSNSNFMYLVSDLINSSSKELKISMDYSVYDSELLNTYSHTLEIKLVDGTAYIYRECLERYLGITVNSETKKIFEIINGKVTEFFESNELIDEVINKYIVSISGILSIASLPYNRSFYEDIKTIFDPDTDDGSALLADILHATFFSRNINVYLDKKDSHKNSPSKTYSELINFFDKEYIADTTVNVLNDTIDIKEFSDFKSKINKLRNFIKIFKPELEDINIVKKVDKNRYHIEIEFVYDNYKVNKNYESTGIQKLFNLFEYLNAASMGEIAFIDEMDANINDKNLNDLIEYFVLYGQGQLVFTTHNVSPMNILKGIKNGIDFINYDNNIVSWVRNGNNSPVKQYRNGYIPGIPYNSESFDFLSCFE